MRTKSFPDNWKTLITDQAAGGGKVHHLLGKGVMVSYIGERYSWAKYDLLNRAAYDVNSAGEWPSKESDARLIGIGSAGLRYILSEGYPFNSIQGNDDVDRFITQAAIWWYLADKGVGELSSSFKKSSSDPYLIRPEIEALVSAAHVQDNVNDTPVYEYKKADGTSEIVVPCLFTLDDGEEEGVFTPRVVSLLSLDCLSRNAVLSVPDNSSSQFNDGTGQFGLTSSQYRIMKDENNCSAYVLFGGVGMSQPQIIDFVNEKRATGEIPLGADLHFAVAPSAPTPEMRAAGITERRTTLRTDLFSSWHY